MTHRLFVSIVGVLAGALAVVLGPAPAAFASFSATPVGPTGWVPDGPVHAVAVAGNSVFVGGAFTGGVAALDATTGSLIWTGNANGDVRALAVTPDGTHVLAGGAFSTVDGATHRKLASLRVTDGSAEPTWGGAAGGAVRDIVIVGDTAYFGGTFAKHAGVAQANLGAVSVTTGKVDKTFTTSTDGPVYALATDGVRLFIGGKFVTVSGQDRQTLASVTLASRTLDSWAPARACDICNLQWDIVLGGQTLYAVGRNGGAVYAVDTATGGQRWKVSESNGDAQAVTIADGKVFVGGHFTSIAGQSRTILCAFDPVTGALDPTTSARFVKTYPGIWALGTDGGRLYVGGHFTAAGPKPNRYPYFAIFGLT